MNNTVFVPNAVKDVLAGFGSIGSIAVAAQERSGFTSYFGNASSSTPKVIVSEEPANGLSHVIGNLLTLLALFLAFKCKSASGGIDFLQLIIACCCAPCYVVYRLARPCK